MISTSVSGAALERSLDILWQRQQVAMHNIANEDTPGYKARRVEFERILRHQISAQTNVTEFGKRGYAISHDPAKAVEVEDNATVGRADGNNVDIDAEFIEMARIQLQWNLTTQKLGGRYNNLKYAISGGR